MSRRKKYQKHKRKPDIASVGRSEHVPFIEGEAGKERHERRRGHALSNRDDVREWCQERSIKFTVTNEGHHWRFVRRGTSCDWWPSTAKFVVGKQYNRGLHVHDFEQLLGQLIRIFGDKPPMNNPNTWMNRLEEMLPEIQECLQKPDEWDSLIINRRRPFTWRAFRQFGENRVCVHMFEACEPHEAFAHPHPWPGAFLLLKGEYIHRVGYSKDRESEPEFLFSERVRPYSMYEITNQLTWHSVQPLRETWTIMLNGKPWDDSHSQTRTTKGKDLESMNAEELQRHLRCGYHMLQGYFACKGKIENHNH
jgi:hypothetical protein